MLSAILKQSPHRKAVALLLLAAIGGVLFYGLSQANAPRRAPADGDARYDTGMTPSGQMKGFVDHFGGLVDRQGKALAAQSTQLDQLRGENGELKKEGGELRSEIAKLKAAIRSRQDEEEPVKRALEDLKRQILPDGSATASESGARIRKITIATATQEAQRRRAERQVRLPAGSFAEATLLTGVYAPVEGQPMPVKLRLDRAFVGPNRTRIPIQEAVLIGKAMGEPNSERVVIQLDRLSYVKPTGETVEVSINGYVADEDGVQGMAGHYVWRAVDAASLSILSGALSAGSDAAAARETVAQINPLGGKSEVVTGDPLRFAGYRGLSRAGEKLQEIVAKRLEQVVPAVYVPNGKQVTACLLDGVTLENLFTDEVLDASSRSPFAGLDLDR